MKKIFLIVLLLVSKSLAQDRPLSQPFYFWLTTKVSGGTFTNADSAPTWTLLRGNQSGGAATTITTGTLTVMGTGTLAANYYGSLTISSVSFNVGDSYSIEATATISGVPVKTIVRQGLVMPAWTTAGVPPVDLRAWTYTGAGTFSSLAVGTTTFGLTNVGTTTYTQLNVQNGMVVGAFTSNAGIQAATLSLSGAGTFTGGFYGPIQVNTGTMGASIQKILTLEQSR